MPTESEPSSPLHERLRAPGPKRILSLDGGGLRGLISLGVLARMEALLRARHQSSELVLADYFDLISGTSTGALIATLLSLGWSVRDATSLYLELSRQIFKPKQYYGLGFVGRALGSKFDFTPLEKILKNLLGDRALDTIDLQTALLIVVKRADSGSVWPLSNIPTGKYYADVIKPDGTRRRGNRHMKLRDVLRASTAAPTYFHYKLLEDIGYGNEAAFVDGGISAHNNPALLSLLVSQLDGYGLGWKLGPQQLLLCSVGTGTVPSRKTLTQIKAGSNLMWAETIIRQLIGDSSELVQTMLQWLSESPTARTIDSQVGTIRPKLIPSASLLHYLRYDLTLDEADLSRIGLRYTAQVYHRIQQMDSIESVPHFVEIGNAASRQVEDHHFPKAFDRQGPVGTSPKPDLLMGGS